MFFHASAFAQEELLTVTTSAKTYEEGDTIVISGKVNAVIPNTPVNIQVFRDNTMVQIAQLEVGQDGTFTHTILADGPIWKIAGTYVVRAAYGPGTINETNFEFIVKQDIPETSEAFEVDAGNSGTFDIQYTIRGAVVKDMIVDQDILGIRIIIEPADDGEVSLDLPRLSIDAKNSDGIDEIFIILIDGEQVPYEEIADSNSRLITIDFKEEDSEIEIIGTHVIPEFGIMSILILAITIMTVMIFSRKNEYLTRI